MKKNDRIFWIFAGIEYIILVFFLLAKVFSGAIPLWYDPARDMLSAWDNLSKPTLIGPPSGIPGIFYGPYWIWMLSFAQIFSKNTRFVVFLIETVPYLVLFPIILFLFKGIFDRKSAFLLWMLFILGFEKYAYSLWNPYPAPLLFLVAALLFITVNLDDNSWKNRGLACASGFTAGVLVNIHLSFGIGVIFGIIVFETVMFLSRFKVLKKTNKFFIWFSNLLLIVFGFLISLIPFFLFELRHGFTQTKTFINTFSHFGGVVTVSGLTKEQILHSFFESFSKLLAMPYMFSIFLLVIGILYVLYSWGKKNSFSEKEKKLVIFLMCVASAIVVLYLTAKNPIWAYHFIGVEVIFLLMLGMVLQKIKILRWIIGMWVAVLLVLFVRGMTASLKINPSNVAGNVAAEEEIANIINSNAKGRDYTVFVYSPAIYSYEYSYIFKYLYSKDVPYRPELNPQNSKLVYLVFPPQVKQAIYDDFIHFRTPPASYKTKYRWNLPSGSIILKRVRIQ